MSDCEGPISKNDNAFELASIFIPDGENFFTKLSRYDDILADIIKRPGYKAGNTLKFIVPFLKVYGATNQKIFKYSLENLLLLPSASETLRYIIDIMPAYIVSTSYEQYLKSICKVVGFPYRNVYCTKLDIDKYTINSEEAERLKELREEISRMPIIKIPPEAKSIDDLSSSDREVLERLNEIFWSEIPKMKCGVMLDEVDPVGGYEKAKAVTEIVEKHKAKVEDVIYVGDSITDTDSFRLVREGGGLTVSFNGNEYAVREAELAIISSNTLITALIAYVFRKIGKEAVIELAEGWPDILNKYADHPFYERLRRDLPRVEVVSETNLPALIEESVLFRKKVRGEKIGALG